MAYIDKYKQKWFYSLKDKEKTKGLFHHYPRSTLSNSGKLLIQLKVKEDEYLHTLFDSFIEFNKYQLNIKVENRGYFETILGESYQKMYFDVDINLEEEPNADGELIKDDLIKNILISFNQFNLDLKVETDILVCTSHSSKKRSYHVIIDNYSFPNNDHTKAMYYIIVDKMKTEYKKYIDHLYKSLQQFRILGSQKKGTGRIKVFNDRWTLGPITIDHAYPDGTEKGDQVYQLSRTLVTNCKYCIEVPVVRLNEYALKLNAYTIKCKNKNNTNVKVTQELAVKAFNALVRFSKMSVYDDRFPYRLKGAENNVILLKRERPSECQVCSREHEEVVHENEHPFMYIDKKGNLYFDCRRSIYHGDLIRKTLFICNLELPVQMPEDRQDLENTDGTIKVCEDSDDEEVPDFYPEKMDSYSPNLCSITPSPPIERNSHPEERSKPSSPTIERESLSFSTEKSGLYVPTIERESLNSSTERNVQPVFISQDKRDVVKIGLSDESVTPDVINKNNEKKKVRHNPMSCRKFQDNHKSTTYLVRSWEQDRTDTISKIEKPKEKMIKN